MADGERQNVGGRREVTAWNVLRERFGPTGGTEVVTHEQEGDRYRTMSWLKGIVDAQRSLLPPRQGVRVSQ